MPIIHIVLCIVGAWIVLSAALVTIICMNSSRLSRIDEPFKDHNEILLNWYASGQEPDSHERESDD